jgi:hypothetical protein
MSGVIHSAPSHQAGERGEERDDIAAPIARCYLTVILTYPPYNAVRGLLTRISHRPARSCPAQLPGQR